MSQRLAAIGMAATRMAAARCLAIATALLLFGGCVSTPTTKSTGERIDDSAIATKIKTALLANRKTDGLDIEVDVFKGRVQLNGFADNEEEVTTAHDIATGVKGVVAVENNLTVAEGRRFGRYVDDKLLGARIKTALTRASDVRAFIIEVEVNQGIVQLGGFVNTDQQRRRAGEVAQGVRGVQSVANNIELKAPGSQATTAPPATPVPPTAPPTPEAAP